MKLIIKLISAGLLSLAIVYSSYAEHPTVTTYKDACKDFPNSKQFLCQDFATMGYAIAGIEKLTDICLPGDFPRYNEHEKAQELTALIVTTVGNFIAMTEALKPIVEVTPNPEETKRYLDYYDAAGIGQLMALAFSDKYRCQ